MHLDNTTLACFKKNLVLTVEWKVRKDWTLIWVLGVIFYKESKI